MDEQNRVDWLDLVDEDRAERMWDEYIDTDLSISLAVTVTDEDRDELPVFMQTIKESFEIR